MGLVLGGLAPVGTAASDAAFPTDFDPIQARQDYEEVWGTPDNPVAYAKPGDQDKWGPGGPPTMIFAGDALTMVPDTDLGSTEPPITSVADALSAEYALQQFDPREIAVLKGVEPGRIVNVLGQHDHVDQLLSLMEVPYTNAQPVYIPGLTESVALPASAPGAIEAVPTLSDAMLAEAFVVFVNCQRRDLDSVAQRLARWVEDGGHLVTTDWCLGSIIARGFPNTIFPAHGIATGNSINYPVSALSTKNQGIDGLVRVRDANTQPVWFVEGASEVVDYADRRGFNAAGGRVLAYSQALKDAYKHGTIAVRFPVGKGWVTHFVSHLWRQFIRPEETGNTDAATSLNPGTMTDDLTSKMTEAGVKVGQVQSTASTVGVVTADLLHTILPKSGKP